MEEEYKTFVFAKPKETNSNLEIEGNIIYDKKINGEKLNLTIYNQQNKENSTKVLTYNFEKKGGENLLVFEIDGEKIQTYKHAESIRRDLIEQGCTTALYAGKQLNNQKIFLAPHKDSGLEDKIKTTNQNKIREMANILVKY